MTTRASTPAIERIAAKLDVADCWLWTGGARNRGGYGVVRDDEGRAVVTHVAVWRLLVGPISDGMELDHVCRVRTCCNPDHLDEVTRQTNVDRGRYAAGRPRLTVCKRGHAFTTANTKSNGHGRTCRACATSANQRYRARLEDAL